MTDQELKPCPFCGGKGNIFFHPYDGYWCAECAICPCKIKSFFLTEEDAIEAWNKRIKK